MNTTTTNNGLQVKANIKAGGMYRPITIVPAASVRPTSRPAAMLRPTTTAPALNVKANVKAGGMLRQP